MPASHLLRHNTQSGVPQGAEEKVVTPFAVPKSVPGEKVSMLAHSGEFCRGIRLFIH
jgi:hypothetical protein